MPRKQATKEKKTAAKKTAVPMRPSYKEEAEKLQKELEKLQSELDKAYHRLGDYESADNEYEAELEDLKQIRDSQKKKVETMTLVTAGLEYRINFLETFIREVAPEIFSAYSKAAKE